MSDSFEEFAEEYDELTHFVSQAHHEQLPAQLRRWFDALESSDDAVSERVKWLLQLASWENVESATFKPEDGIGNGIVSWPDEKETRLAYIFVFFKQIAAEKIKAYKYAFHFYSTGDRNINNTVHNLIDQLFIPFSSELRRYLRKNYDDPVEEASEIKVVPASDRLVDINHNSPAYGQLIDAIEALKQDISESNQMPETDKERAIAELSAAERVLEPATARYSILKTIVLSTITWLSLTFAETAVSNASEFAIQKFMDLFPLLF